MKCSKCFICIAVFLAITVVKLTAPDLSNAIISEAMSALNLECGQNDAVAALGASLTDDEIPEKYDVFSTIEN